MVFQMKNMNQKITKQQMEYIIKLLQDGKDLPQEFKYLLFPTKQREYELVYAGKIRKEDLLANEDGVFPVPLQVDKVFNGDEHETFKDDWKNMIVFGDNLQFLKTVYENKDSLIKNKVKGKVKLIYIDPPFATEEDFKGNQGQRAYSDRTKGAEFVEFLRRRLILAKEILADDGSIFVHLDWKKAHYVKLILDEIFGENKLRNEIIWLYHGPGSPKMKQFNRKHDVIFWYVNGGKWTFNQKDIRVPLSGNLGGGWEGLDEKTRKEYAEKGKIPEDWWEFAIAARLKIDGTERTGYPTEKPNKLIERIIKATTKKDDLVLDFFAGSGVVSFMAEKLGRKWIVCDIGKLSYYTMQKRILQIQDSKDLENPKKKFNKKAKNFITTQLGLYDLGKVFELQDEKYKKFVSGLFEVEIKKFKIAGFEFDGKKGEYPVKIFDYRKFKDSSVDEEYLKQIHAVIGKRISGRVYVIAPANYVDFLTDYHEIDALRYYFLKIPYQVIKELHKIPFQKLRQPQSKKNVNDLDEVIGFHFIRQPEVKSEIKTKKDSVNIEISEFKSQYYKDEEGKVLRNFETLAMVLIDSNYNGEEFVMDQVLFADDLLPKKSKKEKDEEDIREELREQKKIVIPLNKEEIGNKIMIVYVDIYGNEFKEIFNI